MINLDIIRDNFSAMPDEKLMQIAREDSPDLTDEAFTILKQEFAKRMLDINYYLPSAAEQAEDEPMPESLIPNSNADDSMMGLSYQKMMYPDDIEKEKKLRENKEAYLAKLTEDDIHLLINKCNRNMLISTCIFIIGFSITIITFVAAGNSGTYLIALGPIMAGGIGFSLAYEKKKEYKYTLEERKRKQSFLNKE